MAGDGVVFGVLAALAVLPPFVFLLWLRNHERNDREPLRAVMRAFLWGGTAGVAIAVLLHILFDFGYTQAGSPIPVASSILAAVVIAPIVEEFSKALGLGLVRKEMTELEDGIIYGAAVGLGFAATENFVYGITALAQSGFGASIATVAIRVFSSMLLHASASAIIGFGYGVVVRRGGVAAEVLPHYIIAVLLHAGYNFLVSIGAMWGFIGALLLVGFMVGNIRRRIRELDALPHQA